MGRNIFLTADQQSEAQALKDLVNPLRGKVGMSKDGEPIIFCKYGQIEWHSFDNQTFAAYTDRPSRKKLLKQQGFQVIQDGDFEVRALFLRERVQDVDKILGLKRKRKGNLANLQSSSRFPA